MDAEIKKKVLVALTALYGKPAAKLEKRISKEEDYEKAFYATMCSTLCEARPREFPARAKQISFLFFISRVFRLRTNATKAR